MLENAFSAENNHQRSIGITHRVDVRAARCAAGYAWTSHLMRMVPLKLIVATRPLVVDDAEAPEIGVRSDGST